MDKKFKDEIIQKVTTGTCDAEIIEYTEGLLMYMHDSSVKYQCNIIKYK